MAATSTEVRGFSYDVNLTGFNISNPRHIEGILKDITPHLLQPKEGKFIIRYYNGCSGFKTRIKELLWQYSYKVNVRYIQPSDKYISHYEVEILDVFEGFGSYYCDNCKDYTKRFSLMHDKICCTLCGIDVHKIKI